ncbi:MAG TPA: 2-C-methyl-D-erythritol 2,4-cyclodiphosphate synthase [Candidatus Lambdaproteobacteria bacterium]|nr:2-C-methyl-D-erythritol 2,4-cyclodiphosphate synthase [Candidatus Lambdaproteobacteria bacterium]HIO11778.1 2-C-methyl-D-erythritol 2,4-cyclodiphosphate synthase [Deltaproteobacteria bacterium]
MYRTGIGFDVHQLAAGRSLIIGGVDINHPKGLLGHSDADVLVHAVMDAILGALALGDIGQHFPDTDSKYHEAYSLELLSLVQGLATEKGFACVNIDSIIMAEKPKMNPHILEMRTNLAAVLKIKTDQVSIKATTTERLGLIGREEGIAAQAIVLLQSTI